jgi:hypothetical protein
MTKQTSPFPPGTPTDLARRTTISELCCAWTVSEREVKAAFKLLRRAESRLEEVFGGSDRHRFTIQSYKHTHLDLSNPSECVERLRRQAWAVIAERLELRTVMSLAQVRELDRQIETGEGLPPIRYDDLFATVEALLNRRGEFLREKVHECYRWLRPDSWNEHRRDSYGYTPLKTNTKSFAAGVGPKVIITYGCERGYSRSGFTVSHHKRDNLRAIDQVFHLLDGKEQPRTFNGELCDAVAEQTKGGASEAQTDYFRVKCYSNQNLHLEFKRRDLLDKFNLMAAGKNLNP